jgi:hypothetical protein
MMEVQDSNDKSPYLNQVMQVTYQNKQCQFLDTFIIYFNSKTVVSATKTKRCHNPEDGASTSPNYKFKVG